MKVTNPPQYYRQIVYLNYKNKRKTFTEIQSNNRTMTSAEHAKDGNVYEDNYNCNNNSLEKLIESPRQ